MGRGGSLRTFSSLSPKDMSIQNSCCVTLFGTPSFRSNRVLQQHVLTDVTYTGKILGKGSYGSVLEVTYGKLECAAKKMHDALLQTDNEELGTLIQKYEQGCQIMASLHHPNITQFLGIYYLPDTQLPLLVMEKLDMNLNDLLEYMPDLPLTLKVSFFKDICSGLDYLHKRSPPIVHRDLTAKNVLLTSSLLAKITDMGNSHIVSMRPGQLARMLSQLPRTLVYMPPEIMSDDYCYEPSLDIFSVGHLALYILTQIFPGNLLPHSYHDPNNHDVLRKRTELERRATCVERLEACVGVYNQSLVDLVKRCLADNPQERPCSEDLIEQSCAIRQEVERSHGGSLLKHIDIGRVQIAKDMKKLQEDQKLEMEKQMDDKVRQLENLQQVNERQSKQLQQQEDELQHHKKMLLDKEEEILHKEGEIQQQMINLQNEIQRQGQELLQKETEIQQQREELQKKHEQIQHLGEELLHKDADIEDKRMELQQLREELQHKEGEIQLHREEIQQLKDSKYNNFGETVEKLLDELQKCKKELQILKGDEIKSPLQLTWIDGPDMPFGMEDYIQMVTIKEIAYVGGGFADPASINNFTVMAYNYTISHSWDKLCQCKTRVFAMVVIDNQLVLVGGMDKKHNPSNLLSVWDASSRCWIHPYKEMPTARSGPSAVVHNQWLVVAGGVSGIPKLSTVELLHTASNQWHSAPTTPTPWNNMKSAILGDTWYLMGGDTDEDKNGTDVVYSVSLPDLISRVTSSTSCSSCCHTWKKISELRLRYSTPLCVGGALLAVGGESVEDDQHVSTIHRYVPKTEQWIEVEQLPSPRLQSACAVTSNKNILIVGGKNSFTGCLSLFQYGILK